MNAYQIVADQNGVWIIDQISNEPFVYDFFNSKFTQAEYRKFSLSAMAVGMPGQLVGSLDGSSELYSKRDDGSWENLQLSAKSFTFSEKGRFFIIEKNGNNAWMQTDCSELMEGDSQE